MKANLKEKKDKLFLPPRDGIVFVKMWNQILPSLKARANFDPAYHLRVLEILCNLFQEEEVMTNTLEILGMTFKTEGGRNGDLVKPRPEVAQLNKVRDQIAKYSKMLGFGVSTKVNHPTAGDSHSSGGGTDEWD